MTAIRSTISKNAAAVSCGGIYNLGGCTLRDSTLSCNTTTAGSGGGLFNDAAATLLSTTITANAAPAGLGDGLIGHPADPNCSAAWGPTEAAPACGLGFEIVPILI